MCDALQVPTMIFFADALPKTATGKIQRRHMVTHFITNGPKQAQPAAGAGAGVRSKL
jgi:acyl-coenzyme A synthetase/AMP-(fatty) acid ligase